MVKKSLKIINELGECYHQIQSKPVLSFQFYPNFSSTSILYKLHSFGDITLRRNFWRMVGVNTRACFTCVKIGAMPLPLSPDWSIKASQPQLCSNRSNCLSIFDRIMHQIGMALLVTGQRDLATMGFKKLPQLGKSLVSGSLL